MHRRVAIALGVLNAASFVGALLVSHLNGTLDMRLDGISLLLAFTAYLLVGLLLIVKRPRNSIGWILAGIGTITNVGVLAEEWAMYGLVTTPGAPGGVAAAWFNGWWWLVLLAGVFVYLPMLFPTGRPISPRWATITKLASVCIAMTVMLSALSPVLLGQDDRYAAVNPIGVSWGNAEQGPLAPVALVISLAAILSAFAAVVVRFRRARGVERQQLKWFLYAVALTIGFSFAGDSGLLPDWVGDSEIFTALQFVMLPAAIAVAVLRYRLYDIDRVISRTLTYAAVTAVLIGLYLAAVTGLTAVTAPATGDSPIAVAAATLLAAAAFRPVRRRVQTAVDRRFNRARYDAARTVDDYRARLRDEVDVDSLRTGLLAAVDDTVQPRTALLWLRSSTEGAS